MWQYILYFILGGGIVALVAYLSDKGNPIVAVLVANIPIFFILNIFMMYKSNGLSGSLIYARGVLLLLPVFMLFVVITMLLLPRLGLPLALFHGTLAYLAITAAYYVARGRKHRKNCKNSLSFEVGQDISPVLCDDDYRYR